jgi:hypothetical protein
MPVPAVAPRAPYLTYGPIPVRPWRALWAAPFFAIALYFGAGILDLDSLECRRDVRGGGQCTLTSGVLGRERIIVPLNDLAGVRIENGEAGLRSRFEVGTLYLERRGAPEAWVTTVSREEAPALARRITGWLGSREPALAINLGQSLFGRAIRTILAVLLGGSGLILVRSALRGIGRYRLSVEANAPRLRIERRIFGVPVSSRSVALENVTDLQVGLEMRRDVWMVRAYAATSEPTVQFGRIELIDATGRRRPVTESWLLGRRVHLLAAVGLRALLGLAPGPVEAALAEASVPVAHPMGTSPIRRLVAASTGAFLFALLIGFIGLCIDGSLGGDMVRGPVIGAALGVVFGAWYFLRAVRAKPID